MRGDESGALCCSARWLNTQPRSTTCIAAPLARTVTSSQSRPQNGQVAWIAGERSGIDSIMGEETGRIRCR